jgi:hypothetical protein
MISRSVPVRIATTSRRDKGLAAAGFIAAADHSRYRITLPDPVYTLKMKVTLFQIYDLKINEY